MFLMNRIKIFFRHLNEIGKSSFFIHFNFFNNAAKFPYRETQPDQSEFPSQNKVLKSLL